VPTTELAVQRTQSEFVAHNRPQRCFLFEQSAQQLVDGQKRKRRSLQTGGQILFLPLSHLADGTASQSTCERAECSSACKTSRDSGSGKQTFFFHDFPDQSLHGWAIGLLAEWLQKGDWSVIDATSFSCVLLVANLKPHQNAICRCDSAAVALRCSGAPCCVEQCARCIYLRRLRYGPAREITMESFPAHIFCFFTRGSEAFLIVSIVFVSHFR